MKSNFNELELLISEFNVNTNIIISDTWVKAEEHNFYNNKRINGRIGGKVRIFSKNNVDFDASMKMHFPFLP